MTRHQRNRPLALMLVAAIAAIAAAAGCTMLERRPGEGDRVLSHVVRPGETLEDLADDYYGDPRRAREIRRFNDIDRGETPEPGAKLDIPMSAKDMQTLDRRRRARVPYNEGLELVEGGSVLDASTLFRRAIDLDPRFAEAHYNLGATYVRMKAYEKARDSFKKAAKLRSDNADYRYAIGSAHFHLERYDRAANEFRKALKIDPYHLKAAYSIALAYEKMQHSKRAKKYWRLYLRLDDSSEWADEARKRLQSRESQQKR
jgi:tetratricopeptide (TPR) repeat protein